MGSLTWQISTHPILTSGNSSEEKYLESSLIPTYILPVLEKSEIFPRLGKIKIAEMLPSHFSRISLGMSSKFRDCLRKYEASAGITSESISNFGTSPISVQILSEFKTIPL
jgi:hypothetical protein